MPKREGETVAINLSPHHYQRRTFTKIKRGTRAVQWCSWCRSMMRLATMCPVEALAIAGRLALQGSGEE